MQGLGFRDFVRVRKGADAMSVPFLTGLLEERIYSGKSQPDIDGLQQYVE